jgi:hypothetical protein
MTRADPRFPVGQARLEALGVLGCASVMAVASFEVRERGAEGRVWECSCPWPPHARRGVWPSEVQWVGQHARTPRCSIAQFASCRPPTKQGRGRVGWGPVERIRKG